jgi:hypothetical protein
MEQGAGLLGVRQPGGAGEHGNNCPGERNGCDCDQLGGRRESVTRWLQPRSDCRCRDGP